jgi:hypothetical protein
MGRCLRCGAMTIFLRLRRCHACGLPELAGVESPIARREADAGRANDLIEVTGLIEDDDLSALFDRVGLPATSDLKPDDLIKEAKRNGSAQD